MAFLRPELDHILHMMRATPSGVTLDFLISRHGSLEAARAQSKAFRLAIANVRNEERGLIRKQKGKYRVTAPLDLMIMSHYETGEGAFVQMRHEANPLVNVLSYARFTNPKEAEGDAWGTASGNARNLEDALYAPLDAIVQAQGKTGPSPAAQRTTQTLSTESHFHDERLPQGGGFAELAQISDDEELDFGS